MRRGRVVVVFYRSGSGSEGLVGLRRGSGGAVRVAFGRVVGSRGVGIVGIIFVVIDSSGDLRESRLSTRVVSAALTSERTESGRSSASLDEGGTVMFLHFSAQSSATGRMRTLGVEGGAIVGRGGDLGPADVVGAIEVVLSSSFASEAEYDEERQQGERPQDGADDDPSARSRGESRRLGLSGFGGSGGSGRGREGRDERGRAEG